ncbi:hypothetical protein A2154_01760 [Candidatus Gottesmanbacteria bacterium RBG_16_43_7]|uniref:Uncharacterized protein n=1 Tax=Candidatus Gottesmanbacteria bacterium RBG_16_43_7 TaxID=1798373 RepID=A0A1F5Z9E3_9BACT|nr:MAG: hypothetical protein A2154_01760 [Candidatus Gottesmanbacteria bacterium RBG_16_43_7]
MTGFIVEPGVEVKTQNSKLKITTQNSKVNYEPSVNNQEPITNNESRWIIKKQGVEGLVEAIGRIGQIDRAACRRHVEENFSEAQMVNGYEEVYGKVIGTI